MKQFLYVVSITLLAFTLPNCARNPVTGKKQVVLMSEAQEIEMGKSADPQVIAQFGLYEDSSLQNFFARKGQEMAAISHRTNITYNFRILNSDVLNAFAVPGGYVYFTRGIMAHFNSEADMAGVLGHEIGHVAARHTVSQQRNATLGQIGILAGSIFSPTFAQFGQAASQGLGLLLLKNSRDAEREADRLGVEYSSKINYDAHQMAKFFLTLERETAASGGQELPDFLSSHPNPGDRNVTVEKLATEWQQKLNLTNPQINRNSYLGRLEGLVFGEDPREGFLENSVFYHPVLKFQFPVPTNWNYQNTPSAVQMAPKDGKALMILMPAAGNNLRDAANAAVQQYKLQVLESRETTVNGLPAVIVVADQQQQQQQQGAAVVRTLSYFIQFGGSIYHLIGMSSQADFQSYTSYFTNTMQGFRELTDAAKLNKKPERVHIKTVNSAITLEQALRNYRVPAQRMEQMAILNGMRLTDRLEAGTLIKVVE